MTPTLGAHRAETDRTDTAALQAVAQLEDVAAVDTAYRDVYLHRARTLLSSRLGEAEYQSFQDDRAALDDALRRLHFSVLHGEWRRVGPLIDRVRAHRQAWDSKRPLVELAAKVYDSRLVPLAPFPWACRASRLAPHGSVKA